MHESKANVVNYSPSICWAVVWLSALPHRPRDFPARERSKRDHRRERDGAGRAVRRPLRRGLHHAAVPHAGPQRHAVLQQGESVARTTADQGLGDGVNPFTGCHHDWKHRNVYQHDLYVLANGFTRESNFGRCVFPLRFPPNSLLMNRSLYAAAAEWSSSQLTRSHERPPGSLPRENLLGAVGGRVGATQVGRNVWFSSTGAQVHGRRS